MRYFSIQETLLANAYEFCPEANVAPEWQRLLYEEFYVDWINTFAPNEPLIEAPLDAADLIKFMDAQYAQFLALLIPAVVEQTPRFKSKHIDIHGAQYRVRLTVGTESVTQCFDDLDTARLFRNEMVKIAQAA